MTPLPAVLVGMAAWLVARRHRSRSAGAAGAVVLFPLPALIGVGAAGLLLVRQQVRRRRFEQQAAAGDVLLLAELVGLGLSAGLSLLKALTAAVPHVHRDLAGEVKGVLRRAGHGGLSAALAGTDGHGRRLYLLAARAVVTGAPLGPTVDAFVREAAAERQAAQLEAARRLPVRLMVPLALLILPGFVLLTVGPTVLSALERFALPQ